MAFVLFQGSGAVLHTRDQLSVGQGGFHVAQLLSAAHAAFVVDERAATFRAFGAKPFRYVYDCGSRQLKRCNEVVADHIRNFAKAPIDLLFLSHFDDDHVNGVPTLLNTTTGLSVDTIVMPFVDIVERLVAFGRIRSRSRSVSDFFQGLVVDPTEALAVFRPRRIIFVRSGFDEPRGEPIEVGPSGSDPEAPFHWKLSSSQGGPLGSSTWATGIETVTISDRCWFDITARSSKFDWIFKPYVRRTDPSRIQVFERVAERRLGWQFGSFRKRVSDPLERSHLVRDPDLSEALAGAYKEAFGDRNLTSLCVYAGPGERQKAALTIELRCDRHRTVEKIGWLGTGDAGLAEPKEAVAFVNHFGEQRSAVATYALPHHGAKPNHSALVLSVFEPPTCSVSAKPPINWKHPHPDVIKQVRSMGLLPVHITDRPTSELHEGFLIFP